jgi:hypothetical protein
MYRCIYSIYEKNLQPFFAKKNFRLKKYCKIAMNQWIVFFNDKNVAGTRAALGI